MLKIHHVPRTRSLRVIWLCEELGVPYEIVPVDFTPAFRSSPEWRRLSPTGKVPVMEDDGFSMFESGAMVEWVLERYGQGRLRPPLASAESALYLQWSWFAEATFARPLGEIVNHNRAFGETGVSEEALAEMRSRSRLCLKAVDDAIDGKEYITGEFSAADIMLGYSLYLCERLAPSEECKKASAYWARLQEREACKIAFSA